ATLGFRVSRQVAMRVIGVFPCSEEPAVRPNLGGPQDLPAGPQDDAHRLIGEYHRKAGHTREPSNNPAAGPSCYVPTCQRVTIAGGRWCVIPTRVAPCQLDAAA